MFRRKKRMTMNVRRPEDDDRLKKATKYLAGFERQLAAARNRLAALPQVPSAAERRARRLVHVGADSDDDNVDADFEKLEALASQRSEIAEEILTYENAVRMQREVNEQL